MSSSSLMFPRPLANRKTQDFELQRKVQSNNSESNKNTKNADGTTFDLGINFYDTRGVGRRSIDSPDSQQLQREILENVKMQASSLGLTSMRTPKVPQGSPSDITIATPKVRHPANKNPLTFMIDDMLEEQYRGQAETFVRAASASRSTPSRVTDRSASLGIESTPTPASKTTTNATPHSSLFVQSSILPRGLGLGLNIRSPSSPHPLSTTAAGLLEATNRVQSGGALHSGFSPQPQLSEPPTESFAVRHPSPQVPYSTKPTVPKKKPQRSLEIYFTVEERQKIADQVHAKPLKCEHHFNCKDCINLEYAYHEEKALPRTMDPDQRQKIINNNRSLRNIKNELESLAEHGALSDETYEAIMAALPAESPLGSALRSNNPTPAPAPAPGGLPTAFSGLGISSTPPPPAYNSPSVPALPSRAPVAPPQKPEIARATALYAYSDPNDCSFNAGDQISIFEYMNSDWWLGKNVRTGQEGVFPASYVQVQPQVTASHGVFGNEKQNYGAYSGQQAQQQIPPPGPSNPYNSSAPPMAMAEGDGKPSKGGEMGKKFGKKLGNAAVFGAGATIGGKIVNSIF